MRIVVCVFVLLGAWLYLGSSHTSARSNALAPATQNAESEGNRAQGGAKDDKDGTKGRAPETVTLSKREKKFQESMSHATLKGRWRLVKDGELGEEREDKYALGEVTKIRDGVWKIDAKVQYADKDVALPVPVKVFWTGDTPVIAVTSQLLLGLGRYSARVVIDGGVYAGTWSAGDHGGVMTGVVLRKKRAE